MYSLVDKLKLISLLVWDSEILQHISVFAHTTGHNFVWATNIFCQKQGAFCFSTSTCSATALNRKGRKLNRIINLSTNSGPGAITYEEIDNKLYSGRWRRFVNVSPEDDGSVLFWSDGKFLSDSRCQIQQYANFHLLTLITPTIQSCLHLTYDPFTKFEITVCQVFNQRECSISFLFCIFPTAHFSPL